MTEDIIGRGKEIAERLNAQHRLRAVPGSLPSIREPGTDESKSLLAGMITAAELQHMEFDPLREFVTGIITEGFGILAGPPKLGKSWWILAVALGGYALGLIKVEKRPVLYLALEDSRRRMQKRCAVLLGDDDFPPGLHILTAKDVKPGCVAASIKEWLSRNPGGLVFLDTLGKARPQRRAGDDPYIADYQFGSQLKRLVDDVPGSGLVAAHHTRKMLSEDFLDTISGTQGIAGSADYVLVLGRKRKSSEGVLSVTGRDIEENEYALKVDNGRWSLDGTDILDAAATVNTRRDKGRESNLGTRSLDALAFVNGRETTTPAELAEHLEVRALLEAWFVEHPANAKRDLYNRFTDIDDGQHLGAWWELYIASLFRLLRYDVAAHPTVEGSKRQPDFLMSRGNTSFYIECTVASPGEGAGTRGTPEWIYDCISDVGNPDFLVGIHHIAQGTQRPKRVEVTRPIAQWLGELDPDALLAAPYDQLPRRTITIRDWVITFVALPKRVEARDEGGRLIGFLPPIFGFPVNDVDRIHEALSRKGRRYGREPLSLPLIVAVLTTSGFVKEDDVTDAVFGRKAYEWYAGDPDSVRLVRKRNGYWRGDWSVDDPQRGTRVSAALFGPNIRCDRVPAKLPQLWINPWAAVPFNRDDGFTTTTVRDDDGEIIRNEGTLRAPAVFSLDPAWPFFPEM